MRVLVRNNTNTFFSSLIDLDVEYNKLHRSQILWVTFYLKKNLRNRISHMQIKVNKMKINHTKEKQNIHAHTLKFLQPNEDETKSTIQRKQNWKGGGGKQKMKAN